MANPEYSGSPLAFTATLFLGKEHRRMEETMSDLRLDVDQAGELKAAFRRADYTNEEIKRLCEGSILAEVRQVLRGHSRIVPVEHVVTCTPGSFLSRLGSGWEEEKGSHRDCGTMQLEKRLDGQLYINGKRVERYLSSNQENGRSIQGYQLREEMANQPVLCACVLNYLYQHQDLIPEDWKTGVTFFWGTIFRNRGGLPCVACLYWDGARWYWHCFWLESDWNFFNPAARLAS